MMSIPCRANGIDCSLHDAFRRIFEAHRHRQTRRKLAVYLTFGGAGPDRTPRHQISYELRHNWVKKFCARWQSKFHNVAQKLPRKAQSTVDGKPPIEIGVIDEALPANRGARLLEISSHHDKQFGL